jgi:ADP-ribosylglycohydrolase
MSDHLPPDHAERLALAFDAIDGLSVGDAFGQQYFSFPEWIRPRTLPVGPWHWTDDTAMAIGVYKELERRGRIEQDDLAAVFARNYAADRARGYGGMAHGILRAIHQGEDWCEVAGSAFDGQGSMGNGAAMRVAPLGAYFAGDLGRAAEQAKLSAEVTHAHPDGVAGGVAVAVAAAVVAAGRGDDPDDVRERLWAAVLDLTPPGPTRDGIEKASRLSPESHVDTAAGRLGTGDRVISSDTVPFCLWSAARWIEDYEEALWATVAGLGDRDTTCAIVGGIVAAYAGRESIPSLWRAERESLPVRPAAD